MMGHQGEASWLAALAAAYKTGSEAIRPLQQLLELVHSVFQAERTTALRVLEDGAFVLEHVGEPWAQELEPLAWHTLHQHTPEGCFVPASEGVLGVSAVSGSILALPVGVDRWGVLLVHMPDATTEARAMELGARFAHLFDYGRAQTHIALTLFHSSRVGLCVLDQDGLILAGNRALSQLLGWGEEPVRRVSMFDAFPEADHERVRHVYETFLDGTRKEPNGEWSLQRVDGTRVTALASMSMLPVASGRAPLVLATVVDITPLKRAQHRQSTLANVASDFVYEVTYDLETGTHTTSFTSSGFTRLTGWTVEDSRAQTWLGLVHPDDHARLIAAGDELQRTGRYECDYRLRTRDGGEVWIHDRACMMSQSGSTVTILGAAQDITARRQLAEDLELSRTRYLQLTGIATDYAYELFVDVNDLSTAQTTLSFRFTEITGWTEDEIRELGWRQCIPEEDFARIVRMYTEVLRSTDTTDIEYRFHHKDGHTIWLHDRARLVERDGDWVRVLGAVRDVTDRKLTELALQESEARFRQLTEIAADYTYDVQVNVEDTSQSDTFMSEGALRVTGWTPEEIEEQSWFSLIHPEDRETIELTGRQLAERGRSDLEYRIRHRDGHTVWLHDRARVVRAEGPQVHILGTVRDITDRKEMEVALRESEERYRQMADISADYTYETKGTEDELHDAFFSRALLDRMGLEVNEMLMAQWQRAIHPDDVSVILTHRLRIIQHGYSEAEYRIRDRHGEYFWVFARARRLRTEDGLFRTLGTLLDITDRKRTEQALLHNERNHRLLTEIAADYVYELVFDTTQGARTFAITSDRFTEVTGWTIEEIEGVSWLDLVLEEDREIARAELVDRLLSEHRADVEYRIRHRDGHIVWLRDRARVVAEDGEQVRILGAVLDITDRKEMEAELQQKEERFRLLAGIAADYTFEVAADEEDVLSASFSGALMERLGLEGGDVFVERWLQCFHPDDVPVMIAHRVRLLREGYSETEARLLDRHGEYFWLFIREMQLERHNNTLRTIGTLLDITDRKHTEEALSQKEEHYRLLTEIAADYVYDLMLNIEDSRETRSNMSERFTEVTGWTIKEIEARSWASFIHPDDVGSVGEAVFRSLIETGHSDIEYRFLHRDGHTIWLHDRARLVGVDGVWARVLGTVRDVTDRKEMEADIQRSHNRYQELTDIAADYIYEFVGATDPAFSELFISPALSERLGKTAKELIGTSWQGVIHPDDLPALAAHRKRVIETGASDVEYRCLDRHGVYFWVSARARAIFEEGEQVRILATMLDITDRKKMERALQQSEARFRQISEIAADYVFETAGSIDALDSAFFSQALLDRVGVDTSEVLAQRWMKVMHPEDVGLIQAHRKRIFDEGSSEAEYRIRDRHGAYFWVFARARRLTIGDGVFRTIGTLLDITDRKEMERALQESETRFRQLTAIAADYTYELTVRPVMEDDGEPAFVRAEFSEALLARIGLTDEELQHAPPERIVHPDDVERLGMHRVEVLERGHAELEFRVRAADGTFFWVFSREQLLTRGDGAMHILGTLLDITDRKEMERALQENETRFRQLTSISADYTYELIITPDMDPRADADGRAFAQANFSSDLLARMGLSREDMQHITFSALLHPDDIPTLAEHRERVVTLGHSHAEFRMRSADGAYFWVSARARRLTAKDDATYILGTLLDITDRKEMEGALQQSEERYRLLSELTSDYIYAMRLGEDGELERQWVSRELQDITGYSVEELSRMSWDALYHPDDLEQARLRTERLLRGETNSVELRIFTRDGRVRWLRDVGRPMWDEEGLRVIGILGAGQDITERKEVQQELALQHERTSAILESIRDGFFAVDEHWRFTFLNRNAERYLARSTEGLLGAPFWDVVPELYADAFGEMLRRARRSGHAQREELILPHTHELLWADVQVFPFEGGVSVYLRDITARKLTEQQLRLLESAVVHINDAVLITHAEPLDPPGPEIIWVNEAFTDITGYSLHEIRGQTPRILQGPATSRIALKSMRDALEAGVDTHVELINYTRDGEPFWSELDVVPVHDDHGQMTHWVAVLRDITARKHAENNSMARQYILEMIARNAPMTRILDAVASLIESMSPNLLASILLHRDGHLYHGAAPRLPVEYTRAIDGAAIGPEAGSCGTAVYTRELVIAEDIALDPRWARWKDLALSHGLRSCWSLPILNQHGDVLGTLALYYGAPRRPQTEEIEQLREHAQLLELALEHQRLNDELAHQAQHDMLTGLPNRFLLRDRLAQAIHVAEREGDSVAVVWLDLDNFKRINDSLGHSAGDMLLQETSHRLTATLRPGDTVARHGGDEFVLILPNTNREEAEATITQIQGAFEGSFDIFGHELIVTPSIGVVIAPEHGNDPEQLLRGADTAMYAAKYSPNLQAAFFELTMNTETTRRLQVEAELRRAVVQDELTVFYQPRVSLGTGNILGGEALVRWNHPERGLLSPGYFLPIAEQTGLMPAIDRWVHQRVYRDLAVWQERGYSCRISINVSADELLDESFLLELAEQVGQSGLRPGSLEFEITENLLLRDATRATAHLHLIKRRIPGVHIALDDFGSGYSSLGYLQHLPLDTLKIDQSFVRALLSDESTAGRAIIRAVVDIAESLGMSVVAEGIEEREQWDILSALQCHEGQGYFMAPPMPRERFEKLLSGEVSLDLD